jgi:hypothetical protein
MTSPHRAVASPAIAPTPRPRLVLVSPRRTAIGRLPFVIVVGTILVTGLVAVLVLHMFAAQYAFRGTAMQARLNGLTNQVQQEQGAVERDSSPIALQRNAATLGMLPSTVTHIHRTSSGRVIGLATAVAPPVVVAPVTTTTSTKTAKSTKTTTKTTTSTKTGKPANAATATKTVTTTTSGTSGKHHHSHGTQAPQQ